MKERMIDGIVDNNIADINNMNDNLMIMKIDSFAWIRFDESTDMKCDLSLSLSLSLFVYLYI